MKKQLQGCSLILLSILLVLMDMNGMWMLIMEVVELVEDIVYDIVNIELDFWSLVIHLLVIIGLVLIFNKVDNKEEHHL